MSRFAGNLSLLMLSFAVAGGIVPAAAAKGESGAVRVISNGARVEIHVPAEALTVEVRPLLNGQPGPTLMGRTVKAGTGAAFIPAVPLMAGQTYRVRWRAPSGAEEQGDVTRPAAQATAPTVEMRPAGPLPANVLKVYLHFSEAMEQGIFLDRLRLVDGQGNEVPGPFRETELWSPDGKRLTVWFHPGRQKAGVNLNVDEGPVLRAGGKYRLVVAGKWRSTAGVGLGADVEFRFAAGEEDHRCPRMEDWRISVPSAGTRGPLRVDFDESLDPAMLRTALRVKGQGGKVLAGEVSIGEDGAFWEWRPEAAWPAGNLELRADPDLEDLAGNSLTKPFEVDANGSTATSSRQVLVRRFEVVRRL